MAQIIRILILGVSIGLLGLYLTACQDSKKDRLQAQDGGVQTAAGGKNQKALSDANLKVLCTSLKKANSTDSAAPAANEKAKQLEEQISKQNRDKEFIALNEKLLNQMDQVFVEVWKKVISKNNDAPLSPFYQARGHLLNQYTLQNGGAVAKDTPSACRNNKQVKLVLTRDDSCLPQVLEWQVQDCSGSKLNWYASSKVLTKDSQGGQLEMHFNPALMPEALGLRLQTLAGNYDAQCIVGYLDSGKLNSLSCLHLGQDESTTSSIEFDSFEYKANDQDNMVKGKASRYVDLVNKDPQNPTLEIRVPMQGAIQVVQFAGNAVARGDATSQQNGNIKTAVDKTLKQGDSAALEPQGGASGQKENENNKDQTNSAGKTQVIKAEKDPRDNQFQSSQSLEEEAARKEEQERQVLKELEEQKREKDLPTGVQPY